MTPAPAIFIIANAWIKLGQIPRRAFNPRLVQIPMVIPYSEPK